jgi:hypothetical protein
METMTGLSSADQAVWRAYEQVLGDECVLTKTDMEALAAALRAAAKPFHWTWNAEMCHKHLVAIADELEAQ